MRVSDPTGNVRALAFGAGHRRWRSALHYGGSLLNGSTPTAYEQLTLLAPHLEEGGLTALGIPGFAGFFLATIEEPENRGGPWTIAITYAFGGEHGDVLIVARRGDVEIRRQGQPVDAAIEVFREAVEPSAIAA